MSRSDRNTILEVYALLENANESYLGLNQVLVPYRCAIVKMGFDEFERKFRVYFGLKPYPDHEQNRSDLTDNESMLLKDELLPIRNSGDLNESSLNKHGYVLLLKKSFVLFEERSKSCLKQVGAFRRLVNDFASSLTRCMCLLGYLDFRFAGSFIYLPSLQKAVARKISPRSTPVYSTISFLNRDRYFVRLYLQFEEKLQKYIRKAVALYFNAINTKDSGDKLLLLKLAFETCFQTNKMNIQTGEEIARYVYVLSNEQALSYQCLCSTFAGLFKHRDVINDEQFGSLIFSNEISCFEKILAGTLRKLIRLNHLKQEMLVEGLDRKFVAMRAAQGGS